LEHTEKLRPPPDPNPPLVVATSPFSDVATNNIVRRRECDIETTGEKESCPEIEATGHADHQFDHYSSRQFSFA